MDRTKIILIGVITFSIVILLGGLFWYLLWGSVNFFGESGFHGEASAFFSGVLGAAFIFAPMITSIVYRLMKHKKQALIMLIGAIICWILFFVVFPLLGKLSDNIRNSAPPEKIAMRAIRRTDKDMEKEGKPMPSDVYAERVGSRLWIFEGTATELDPVKEKEVVEKAAEMVFEKAKNEVSPAFSRYGWRTIYNEREVYYYGMILFYDDDSYVIMYDMEKDRWRETGEPDPPRNEGTKNTRMP